MKFKLFSIFAFALIGVSFNHYSRTFKHSNICNFCINQIILANKFEHDSTGQYLITDVSLVNALNNVHKDHDDISDFYDEFKKSHPTSTHLKWIEQIIFIFAGIKEIFEQLQFKVSAYDGYDFKFLQETMKHLSNDGTKFNIYLDEFKAYLNFGNRIKLDGFFANLNGNYAGLLKQYQNRLATTRDSNECIFLKFNELKNEIDYLKNEILNNLNAIKSSMIPTLRDLTEQIKPDLDSIKNKIFITPLKIRN